MSHWLRVEFSSVIGKYVRMKNFSQSQAFHIMESFEALLMDSFHIVTPTLADFNLATSLLQFFHTGLRAGDALHLAIAQNHGAKKILYT